MSYQFVIVSEDTAMASALSDSAHKLRPAWDSITIDDYSAIGNMRGEIEACDQSALAMIVAVSDPERALYLLQAVKQVFPEITTAAAHPAPSSDLILAAMRAGTAEFLTPPYDLAHLAERVEQGSPEGASEPAGKLFCFMPAKGSSGASTVALHVAAGISSILGERVLFVDFDFHSGEVAFRLRLKPSHTLADALERTGQLHELWKQLVTPWKTLDILPAPSSAGAVSPAVLENVPRFFQAARETYPCVVVDLPDCVLSSCRNLAGMADCVYLVCTPEVVALHLVQRKLHELLQSGVSRDNLEVVVNRAGSRRVLDAGDISKLLGKDVYQTLENSYEAVNAASLRGELLGEDTKLGRQFRKFAEKILGSAEKPVKTRATAHRSRSWADFFAMK